MKRLLCLLLLPLHLCAQPPRSASLVPLSIGDAVPALTLSPVLNQPSGRLHLADLKGKLVILDFMATYCLSCLQALPRLDSLQKQFGSQLQIVLVTAEDKQKVMGFLQKSRWGKNIRLPIVVADSSLSALFPHRFLPHEVWIDAKGQIAAITGSDYVDAANIRTLLAGHPVSWPVKRELEYDYSQPLLTLNPENTPPETVPAALYYSAITAYRPGIAPRYNKGLEDSTRGTRTVSMVNLSIWEMYRRAWQLRPQFPHSQVLLQVKDTNRLLFRPGSGYQEAWNRDNAWCYEAVLPLHLPPHEKMRADLDYFFGLQSRLETRKLACLVIRHGSGAAKPAFTKTTPIDSTVSLSDLVWQWNQLWGNIPLMDETGTAGRYYLPVGQQVPGSPESLASLLRSLGLQLQTAERTLQVLVLADATRSAHQP